MGTRFSYGASLLPERRIQQVSQPDASPLEPPAPETLPRDRGDSTL